MNLSRSLSFGGETWLIALLLPQIKYMKMPLFRINQRRRFKLVIT